MGTQDVVTSNSSPTGAFHIFWNHNCFQRRSEESNNRQKEIRLGTKWSGWIWNIEIIYGTKLPKQIIWHTGPTIWPLDRRDLKGDNCIVSVSDSYFYKLRYKCRRGAKWSGRIWTIFNNSTTISSPNTCS